MKKPSFQFYPGDWKKDPHLSKCSPATRGIWIDILCAMHEDDRSGVLRGTYEELGRALRCSPVEIQEACDELRSTGAAAVRLSHGKVTITNRRMKREYLEREGSRLRKIRQRSRSRTHKKDGAVTEKSRSPSSTSTSTTTTDSPPSSSPPRTVETPENPRGFPAVPHSPDDEVDPRIRAGLVRALERYVT